MQYREQFMAEKQIQARQLQNLVDEMKKYKELMETTDEACREKGLIYVIYVAKTYNFI